MTQTKLLSPTLRRIAIVVLLAGTLAFAGCGSAMKTVSSTAANGQVTTQTVPNVHFAKTKFVLHAGLAFGAVHRYIYKPYRSGGFTPVLSHKLALVKDAIKKWNLAGFR